MGGANSYDDEQDHNWGDRGNSSSKLQATHPLTPFLAVLKLRAGKVLRRLRTARYFWQRSQRSTTSITPQPTPLAVRLDMLGCNLNCTLSLSSCSHTEQASSVVCLGRQRSTRHLKMSCCGSSRFSTSTEIPSHLLKPIGTRSRLVSPKDQFRQHIDNQPHT